jgi:predicted nucleic acid-binding protein
MNTKAESRHFNLRSEMQNDEMSREEAERWLAELTANPERMSAKMFQEGYEASLRKSGLSEAEISPLLRKARQVYDDLIEDEADDGVEDEIDGVDWEELEVLITKTNFDPEDTHFKAAALHHVRQLNRCLAALRKGLH